MGCHTNGMTSVMGGEVRNGRSENAVLTNDRRVPHIHRMPWKQEANLGGFRESCAFPYRARGLVQGTRVPLLKYELHPARFSRDVEGYHRSVLATLKSRLVFGGDMVEVRPSLSRKTSEAESPSSERLFELSICRLVTRLRNAVGGPASLRQPTTNPCCAPGAPPQSDWRRQAC